LNIGKNVVKNKKYSGGAPVSLAQNSAAAEKRGRAKIPSPQPFLFARPSDWISEFAVRIFVKKSSDFNQKAPKNNEPACPVGRRSEYILRMREGFEGNDLTSFPGIFHKKIESLPHRLSIFWSF